MNGVENYEKNDMAYFFHLLFLWCDLKLCFLNLLKNLENEKYLKEVIN